MTIGESLKRARNKMGLDLDDVVRSTKIAKMFLIALENDDISSLPKGVYTRNFLRTYARFLKLDEDILTAEYHEQYAVQPIFVVQHEQTKLDNADFVRKRNHRFLLVFCLFLLPALLVFCFWKWHTPLSALFDNVLEMEQWAPASSNDNVQKSVPAKKNNANKPTNHQKESSDQAEVSSLIAVTEEDAANSTASNLPEESDLTDDAVQNQEPQPVEDLNAAGEPASELLLLHNVADATFLPQAAQPANLSETFVISGYAGTVWLEVYIDGKEVTKRWLRQGDTRFYQYGQTNTVVIGDVRRVSVQDGTLFRERAHDQRKLGQLILKNFGPGAFFQSLDAEVARIRLEKQEE